ncbi:Hypothetical_protein [Hexamita inflata]|uniref:Hypothetical_protein n=1 Tax=Hexamita inflata TaxID=28002 RepID=A0AA86NC66_9EUKA|nr:Hypothetical protein HINF_LOCUS4101 [Hexamita inflata]
MIDEKVMISICILTRMLSVFLKIQGMIHVQLRFICVTFHKHCLKLYNEFQPPVQAEGNNEQRETEKREPMSAQKRQAEPVLKVETRLCENLCFAFESLYRSFVPSRESVIYTRYSLLQKINAFFLKQQVQRQFIVEVFVIQLRLTIQLIYNIIIIQRYLLI